MFPTGKKEKDPIFFASHSCWDLAAAEMSKVKQFVSQWKELHAALRSKSFVNVTTTSSFQHPTQCSSTVFHNGTKVFLESLRSLFRTLWSLFEFIMKSFLNVTTTFRFHPTQCCSTVFHNRTKVFLKSLTSFFEVPLKSFWGPFQVFWGLFEVLLKSFCGFWDIFEVFLMSFWCLFEVFLRSL